MFIRWQSRVAYRSPRLAVFTPEAGKLSAFRISNLRQSRKLDENVAAQSRAAIRASFGTESPLTAAPVNLSMNRDGSPRRPRRVQQRNVICQNQFDL
jgi:hypothetical protein